MVQRLRILPPAMRSDAGNELVRLRGSEVLFPSIAALFAEVPSILTICPVKLRARKPYYQVSLLLLSASQSYCRRQEHLVSYFVLVIIGNCLFIVAHPYTHRHCHSQLSVIKGSSFQAVR